MDQNLLCLLKLVKQKNDLNSRRRRFYSRARAVNTHRGCVSFFSEVARLYEGYRKAQSESKALTPQLRTLCKRTGARLKWDDGGFIECVTVGEYWRFHRSEIEQEIVELEMERALLVG